MLLCHYLGLNPELKAKAMFANFHLKSTPSGTNSSWDRDNILSSKGEVVPSQKPITPYCHKSTWENLAWRFQWGTWLDLPIVKGLKNRLNFTWVQEGGISIFRKVIWEIKSYHQRWKTWNSKVHIIQAHTWLDY